MERRYAYGAGVAAVGVVLAVVQTIHGLQQTDRILVLAFEAGPFVLLALALVYTGGWLATNEEYLTETVRILAWGVGTTILFASIAALMLFSQQVNMGTLDRASYVAIDLVTIGAVVGTLVGLYDAQSQKRLRELQRERNRVETFANKAADVNNYGRALNRSDSIHDVSALVIEAMNTLLGVSEAAVIVAGDAFEVVDNTLVGVSEEALENLANRALEEEEAAFLTHEDIPGEIADRESAAVSLLLFSGDEQSVVLVALDDEKAFQEEDVQLVEMLASHAGTALAGQFSSGEGATTEPQSS